MAVFDRYLTQPQERQLLGTIKAHAGVIARRDYQMARLLRNTGIRVGTLVGLTVADARAGIRERRIALRPGICKGGRGYTVFCNRQAQQALRALLFVRREQGHADMDEAPLLVSRKGNALAVRSVQDRFAHWRQVAGLDEAITPHWMRHTVGVRIMRQSTAADPRGVAQAALGHASISSTGIYTRASKEDLADTMQQVGA